MAMEKFETASSGATHKAVPATLVDVIMPTVPLADSTSNLLRAGTYGILGWVFRGYRDTKKFSF